MNRLLLALAACASLTALTAPSARAQNASVVATCASGVALTPGYLSAPLVQNTAGQLCTSGGGGGSGGNDAASLTGSAVPLYADYVGFNVGGNLTGVSAANPLPITGSISATNPSVSATGAAAPASATLVGATQSGNIVSLTASSGRLVVDGSAVTQPVSGTFWQATQPVSGTLAATQSGTWNIGSVTTLPALVAGSAIIGNVRVDQTTVGTTNGVTIVPSASAAGGITPVVTSAVASNLVGKGSAGALYAWRATTGATAGYVMIFNATSAPADGAVTPVDCVAAPANTTVGGQLDIPELFATGITLVFSSTGCFTKTASATAFLKADVK